jgi:hypothetical protein
MARKYRLFTGDDVKRLYCKNLSSTQRVIFDSLECDWDDLSDMEQLKKIWDVFKGIVDNSIQLLPYGNYLALAMDAITLLLDNNLVDVQFLPAPKTPAANLELIDLLKIDF